jgi:hypothetical protein
MGNRRSTLAKVAVAKSMTAPALTVRDVKAAADASKHGNNLKEEAKRLIKIQN